jgi:hypothetical protein
VLISPIAVTQADWANHALAVSLTREQVKNSPDIDTHKPVSRQHEIAFARYYNYPYYWGGAALWGASPYPAPMTPEEIAMAEEAEQAEQARARAQGDDHLRSTTEVAGYRLQATDGELGHVADFLVSDDTWAIRYLVVATGKWWFGKQVLVATDMIRSVSWPDKHVTVDLTRELVKSAPEYDRAVHSDRQWEADYYRHYQRVPYWARPDLDRTEPRVDGKR